MSQPRCEILAAESVLAENEASSSKKRVEENVLMENVAADILMAEAVVAKDVVVEVCNDVVDVDVHEDRRPHVGRRELER